MLSRNAWLSQAACCNFTEPSALQERKLSTDGTQICGGNMFCFLIPTNKQDMLMLREMIVSDVFSFKKGSVSRRNAWNLSQSYVDSPQFRIKNKRGVRERWDIASTKIQLATLLLIHAAESMSSRLNGPYCWWLKYGFLD